MTMLQATWAGDPPTQCNLCHGTIRVDFIDGATTSGPWACMCPECHRNRGRGLGTGKGQRYQKSDKDGKWYKVQG